MTFSRQNYFSSFCGSAIARDLYFLPPSWLLQAAILPKITLLIVVRSKAILKFKLEVEFRTGSENLNILMILATTTKNEMQLDSLFWLTCVAHYKWWLSSVITHPPDVAQNSNYLSIRYHIFTRNHGVLSTDISRLFPKQNNMPGHILLRFLRSISFLTKMLVENNCRLFQR